MANFTTTTLDLTNDFASTLEAVRLQINDIRLPDGGPEEIIVPVQMQGGRIFLVLNNARNDQGAFDANLYVRRILNEDQVEVYNQAENKEGYIDYDDTLPTVNFAQMHVNNVMDRLQGNYHTHVRSMVIQLAMLVEGIRDNLVGDAIADSLTHWSDLSFANYNDIIRNWENNSKKYVSNVTTHMEQGFPGSLVDNPLAYGELQQEKEIEKEIPKEFEEVEATGEDNPADDTEEVVIMPPDLAQYDPTEIVPGGLVRPALNPEILQRVMRYMDQSAAEESAVDSEEDSGATGESSSTRITIADQDADCEPLFSEFAEEEEAEVMGHDHEGLVQIIGSDAEVTDDDSDSDDEFLKAVEDGDIDEKFLTPEMLKELGVMGDMEKLTALRNGIAQDVEAGGDDDIDVQEFYEEQLQMLDEMEATYAARGSNIEMTITKVDDDSKEQDEESKSYAEEDTAPREYHLGSAADDSDVEAGEGEPTTPKTIDPEGWMERFGLDVVASLSFDFMGFDSSDDPAQDKDQELHPDFDSTTATLSTAQLLLLAGVVPVANAITSIDKGIS